MADEASGGEQSISSYQEAKGKNSWDWLKNPDSITSLSPESGLSKFLEQLNAQAGERRIEGGPTPQALDSALTVNELTRLHPLLMDCIDSKVPDQFQHKVKEAYLAGNKEVIQALAYQLEENIRESYPKTPVEEKKLAKLNYDLAKQLANHMAKFSKKEGLSYSRAPYLRKGNTWDVVLSEHPQKAQSFQKPNKVVPIPVTPKVTPIRRAA